MLLSVPYPDQDSVRDTEKAINDLYSDWRVKFPRKNPQELLAMIAYQYASFYYALSARYDDMSEQLRGVSADLDRLLHTDAEQPGTDTDPDIDTLF